MASRAVASVLLGACLVVFVLQGARVAFTSANRVGSATTEQTSPSHASTRQAVLNPALSELPETPYVSPWELAVRILAGFGVGMMLLVALATPARADTGEDTAIPVDSKGKTVTLTKEEIIRGKRLFNNACANCHVGGGTRTNQNVGLGFEELSGAQPPRNNVESIVDYINAPTTYDGLKDISEVHPSIKAADVWPKMQTMKQKDLYDISAYILYQNFTIPEKWGGGKQYY